MITLERLSKLTLKDKLVELSALYPITKGFFGVFSTMHVFLNLNGPGLFFASNDNEKYIVVFKSNKKEYRFLFKKPSDEFIKEFMEQEQPRYLATNMLNERTGAEIWMEEKELVLDLEKLVSLADHDFRKDYNRAMRKNPPFEILPYHYHRDTADLLVFLETWRNGRTPEKNAIAAIENDLNFLTVFGREDFVYGVVIRHEGNIIAYCLYSDYLPEVCTGLFSKVLRGYENLGVVLTFEKCKSMMSNGFKFSYIANFNNDFKKSLASWAGEEIAIYAERIYKDEGMTFASTPERYLNSMRM